MNSWLGTWWNVFQLTKPKAGYERASTSDNKASSPVYSIQASWPKPLLEVSLFLPLFTNLTYLVFLSIKHDTFTALGEIINQAAGQLYFQQLQELTVAGDSPYFGDDTSQNCTIEQLSPWFLPPRLRSLAANALYYTKGLGAVEKASRSEWPFCRGRIELQHLALLNSTCEDEDPESWLNQLENLRNFVWEDNLPYGEPFLIEMPGFDMVRFKHGRLFIAPESRNASLSSAIMDDHERSPLDNDGTASSSLPTDSTADETLLL
jgi:hypothetical protein